MRRPIPVLAALLSLAAGPAFAHAGHAVAGGFTAGFLHPLTGLDHLLAMIAVGLWAGLALQRAWWVWPAAFVGAMLAGFAFGVGGPALAAVESLILVSTITLGLAVAVELKAPAAIGAAAVAAFGFAHGYAHGQELPVEAARGGFAAGFLLATVMLHGAGLGFAWRLRRLKAGLLVRAAGIGAAVTGVALAWQA